MTSRQHSHLPGSTLCTAWPGPGPDSNLTPFYPQASVSGLPPLNLNPQSAQGPGRRTPAPCPSSKGSPRKPAQLYTLCPCLCSLKATVLLLILQFPKVPGASHLTVTASVPLTHQKVGWEQCQPLP